jgi:hypothetical protein
MISGYCSLPAQGLRFRECNIRDFKSVMQKENGFFLNFLGVGCFDGERGENEGHLRKYFLEET